MKNSAVITTGFLIILSLTFSQSTKAADIRLEKDITTDYITYLGQKEAEYLLVVNSPIAGDDTPTMKAYMGLAILQAAWMHVNGDTLVTDLDELFNQIGENSENILMQTVCDIFPLFFADNPNEFVLNLTDFFQSGTWPTYRDSLDKWLINIDDNINNIGTSADWFIDKTDPLVNIFGDYWDAVADGTADFEFTVQLGGTQYEDTLFVFSRTFFNRLHDLDMLAETTANALDSGFTRILDSLNINSDDIEPGVIVAREGLDSLYTLLDSVQILLWNQPFAPFELDLAGFDSLQEAIMEFDTLLAGKEYPIGPETENKTIRPRGIIESLADSDGPWGIYQDFYRAGEPISFTFSNTFPHGVTSDMYAMIVSDIILNANDTKFQFETKLHTYQAALQLKEHLYPSSVTPDEHLGIALTLLYDLLTDEEYFGNFEQAFYFISEGYIDSLTYYYDWSSFDLQDKIDEIRYHIDKYIESDVVTNYVILIKENYDGLGSYEIGPNTEFSINYLTAPNVMTMVESIEMGMKALSMITDGMNHLYRELDNIFILDLDPSYLDFSNVESDQDIILILEQSNPDFLTVTPYGVEKFHEMGEWFKNAFYELNTFFENMSNLMTAMKPYESDFDMNTDEMKFMMENSAYMTHEMYEDFTYPDSTMWIDGERVNLSAWFDNPPASFLQMWKNFAFGVDSTMGGMFPDRFKANRVTDLPVLPKQFKLYPVYPNPFNPVARIEFNLPKSADVRLSVINLNGETVQELINGHVKAGRYVTTWNAANHPSGIYFCRMNIDGHITTRKMTLMK